MVAEVVATPSTPGVIAAAGLVARISKGSVPTLHEFAPGRSTTDQAQTSYLVVQTTGDFRQTPGRGGGPKSRCQTLPSSN
jgi:hypothetical protein